MHALVKYWAIMKRQVQNMKVTKMKSGKIKTCRSFGVTPSKDYMKMHKEDKKRPQEETNGLEREIWKLREELSHSTCLVMINKTKLLVATRM